MRPAAAAVRFLEGLEVPTGARAGRRLKLAPYQKAFIAGALKSDTNVACLAVARGGGKSALSSGLAIGALLGAWDPQRQREVLLAGRTRDQARVCWDYAATLARSLPEDVQKRLVFRRAPRLEIELQDDTGPHLLRAIAADGKNVLGTSPTLVIMDERAHWARDQGDSLEAALMSGTGKRGGSTLMISTSAADDSHAFSKWLDEEQPGVYRQEHRPAPGLPADDLASLLLGNPGCKFGIGASEEWLLAQARLAIRRGGSTLSNFRLFNRNERVSGESRDVLLTVDEWLACETAELPPREGPCIIGCDLGGSASMSAAAFYWPTSARLEVRAWFPSKPSLSDRGASDGVSGRYTEMRDRNELETLGDATVPVAAWLVEVMRHVEGETVAAIVADRYKQSEVGEALVKAGIRAPVVWRGMGFRDGNEDVMRLQRACYDGRVKSKPSLLLRSAFAECVCLRDPANNIKLARARSNGRIDPASAAVLAVAEGARIAGRGAKKARPAVWA